MPRDATFRILRLMPGDMALTHGMLTLFGEAFEDADTYGKKRPSATYLDKLLGGQTFIALVALQADEVVGGLAAYEMQKFEQERSEIYIYDLAVSAAHRRIGVATALIEELRRIAKARGAYVVYVQADLVDAPAIALYTKLGIREDVLHFDIAVGGLSKPSIRLTISRHNSFADIRDLIEVAGTLAIGGNSLATTGSIQLFANPTEATKAKAPQKKAEDGGGWHGRFRPERTGRVAGRLTHVAAPALAEAARGQALLMLRSTLARL